ncbi:hypothetical protein HK097_006830, partial [Rhizophlyctis rosea]
MPSDAFEAEYESCTSVFAIANSNRFSCPEIESLIHRISSTPSPTDDILRISQKILDTTTTLPIIDPLPPHPISNVRRLGLFTSSQIVPGQYICDIRGDLLPVRELWNRKLKAVDVPIQQDSSIAPPFVFSHPSKRVRLDDGEGVVVDAREYGARDGRFLRGWCGGVGLGLEEGSGDRCNAILKTIIVDDSEESELQTELFPNERFLLGVFATEVIQPGEEIILDRREWPGYPCVCEDEEGCRVVKGIAEHEKWRKEVEEEEVRRAAEERARIEAQAVAGAASAKLERRKEKEKKQVEKERDEEVDKDDA